MKEEGKTEKLVETNQEEKKKKKEPKRVSTPKLPEQDEFFGYTKAAKYQLFILFFLLGIINHLGTILVMTGGRLLAYELEMKDYVTIYTSVATIFSVFTRIINSKICIKVSYKKRVVFICFWMMFGYLSMFAVLTLHETILEENNVLCFILSFIPCFFLGSSYAFGESAMLAYLRLFPKTLIAGWSSGTGLSGIISGGLNLLSQLLNGLSLKYLYLLLTPVGLLYLIFFMWTYRILRRQERRKERQSRLSAISLGKDPSLRRTNLEEMKSKIEKDKKEEMETEKGCEEKDEEKGEDNNDENNEEEENDEEKGIKQDEQKAQMEQIYGNVELSLEEEEELEKSFREKDDKELEEMNHKNKDMSCTNFKKVMSMCGEVIVNLGLIYFLQFFCVNSLVVRNCDKVDVAFLPKACGELGHYYRKGKFEFINMSYQLGMFTAKTLIKIVRKIHPIEIYTSVMILMNVIYIMQYYTGMLHWGFFLGLGFTLGFFAGGTYSGGFYTILNSDQVEKDYKELTVNVATLFNDSGTFLSGIAGFFALNYLFDDSNPFEGQELIPHDCIPE